tara:strand:+ start:437 stop:607 length:171 start_codon:yes stop_codon:yes gene_type:complete
MKKEITLFLGLLGFVSLTFAQRAITNYSTLIKNNHNNGLTNPVHDSNSPMTLPHRC